MHYINSIINKVKKNPLFFVLLLILLIITLFNLKPDFYLMGWDNYSSYLNIKDNFFRTLFSTWREYRGLGVPSDSEVTDIFRLGLFALLKPIIPTQLLDQLYYLLSLNLGVLGMYALTRELVKKIGNSTLKENINIFSFFSAFFYLFNLNTLAVFYFPMTMFVSRFFSLPLLYLVFHQLIYSKKLSFKKNILFVALLFFISGSFLVPTVFVALIIALLPYLITQRNLKKSLLVGLVFILINSFWLFPFVNYIKERSNNVKLASTFIDGNEDFLNKNPEYYSFRRQSLVTPQFFEMKYTETGSKQTKFFHPLAEKLNRYPNNFIYLYLFPLLYLAGVVITVVKFKRKKEWLWVPVTLLTFLFLSLKEHSFLGTLYFLLTKYIPFFGVIFRYGDTKFHALVAFSGSISAAIAIVYLYKYINRKEVKQKLVLFILSLLIIPHLVLFKEYFTRNLVGFFMYNKIPKAYFQVANVINNDKEEARVLHLPIDKNNYYWKSYTWGYFGSAFFQYMLNKPLIDKTFLPSSLENDYYIEQINTYFKNISGSTNQKLINNQVEELAKLIRKSNVKYILLDESVSNSVPSRNMTFWGTNTITEEKRAIKGLLQKGLIKKLENYTINLDKEANYSKLYPYSQANFPKEKDKKSNLGLYEVKDFQGKVSFPEKTELLDYNFDRPLKNIASAYTTHFMQKKDWAGTIWPFRYTDGLINIKNGELEFNIPADTSSKKYRLEYELNNLEQLSNIVDIYTEVKAKELIVSLYLKVFPDINGQTFQKPLKTLRIPIKKFSLNKSVKESPKNALNNWTELENNVYKNIRLRIGEITVPIPINNNQPSYAGSVMVRNNNFLVEVLSEYLNITIPLENFQTINNPDCYNDALADYQSTSQANADALAVIAQNGSSCFANTNLVPEEYPDVSHAEIHLVAQGSSEDLDSLYWKNNKTGKSSLVKALQTLPKPSHLKICFKEKGLDECLNYKDINLPLEPKTFLIPIDKQITDLRNYEIFLGLRNIGYQRQNMIINNMVARLFKTEYSEKVSFNKSKYVTEIDLTKGSNIVFSMPIVLNPSSQKIDIKTNSFYFHNQLCENYSTFRLVEQQLLGYHNSCENVLFSRLPFSSNSFYIWHINYNLLSGQFPFIIMEDTMHQYKYERTSINQNYPDIPNFGSLNFITPLTTQESLFYKFYALPQETSYSYIYPKSYLKDSKNKSYFFKEYSENEGMFALSAFNIVELPNYWSNLKLVPPNNEQIYSAPQSYSFKKLLPSLWQIDITSESNEKVLLFFNEGFDRQWGLYEKLSDSVVGKKTATSIRCDGFANCFEFTPKNNRYYIFYSPELLSIIGWLFSIFGSLSLIIFFRKKETLPETKL